MAMDRGRLGEPDLKAAGFQLWIHAREFPDAETSTDGNWLIVSAHAGGNGASVWVTGAILEVTDLVRWADQCEALWRGQREHAALSPVQPELGVAIRPADRLGHLSMRVDISADHLGQGHWFEFEIDQSYLPEIAKQCRAIAVRYPVRGPS